MATKDQELRGEGYLMKAEPDEPLFVLLGRDPLSPELVRQWAALAYDQPMQKRQEAAALADAMDEYRIARRAREREDTRTARSRDEGDGQ